MLNVAIYIMLRNSMSIQFQVSGSQVQFSGDFYSIISFNSKKIHPQFTVKTRSNSLPLRVIDTLNSSVIVMYVIGLLLSWRMIFPLKRCFVIFVAFGKNVVCPDKHIFSSPNQIPKKCSFASRSAAYM